MAQIEVRGLGANEIRIGRRRITPATEVVFALAFYLCVRAGERVTRDEVMEVFWGTGDVTKGRHSLRQMLYKLRQRGFALDEDGEELYLDPSRLRSDVADALQDSWSDDASVASLEASLDLVPALTKGVSSRFHEWLDGIRARLGAQHRRAAIRHLHQARREGRWADLDRIALLMLRTDPLNEEATLARAESAAMIGSKALALEILDQYVEELGDKATRIALPATVLRRRIGERGSSERFSRHRGDTRLVGRETLIARITPLVEAATSQCGNSIHLVGSPGIGKSRLASEILNYASLVGYRTLAHRAQGLSSGLPFATIVQLIRQVSELPGAAAVSPEAWALASRLLVEGGTPDPATGSDGIPVSPSRLTWLLSSLVESVTHESKLAVLVDDLHNWDSVSESILMDVLRLTRDCRCFWMSTGRRLPRIHDREALDGFSGTIYRVPPLTVGASRELAEVLASASGSTDATARAHGAAHASGGNPLFIRELLAGSDRVTTSAVPMSLSRIIEERLCALPAASQRLLRVVRLLGPYASIPVVARVVHKEASVPTPDIEHLEQEGILTIASGGVLSIHECWQSLVDSQMASATKAALTYECAVALRTHASGRTTAFSAMYLGELFLASGSDMEAREHFQFAAEQFSSLGLATHSARAYEKIVDTSGPTNNDASLLARYAAASHSCGRYNKCHEITERILSAPNAGAIVSEDERVHLLALRVDCLWRVGGDATPAIEELLAALKREQASGAVIQAAAFWGLRCVLVHSRTAAEDAFVDASAKAARTSGQTIFGALASVMYAADRGTREDILRAADSVANKTTSGLSPLENVMATRLTATALRFANEHQRAELLLEMAVRTALEHDLVNEAKAAAISAAFSALDTNRIEEAKRWIDMTDSWTDEFDSLNSNISRNHALSRLFAQQGRFRDSLAVFEDRLHEVENDRLKLRSCAVASCLHWAAAEHGETQTALRLLEHTRQASRDEHPAMPLDFITECRIRTLKALGRHDEASAEATEYTNRIGRRSAYPFAPFYRELEQRRTEMSASANLRRNKKRLEA
ncbi:MAG: AAA family ATPase [Gemmatimonadaceae bacterium]|nr:AAA family ATPase [Gemmatimonadaceae bacterium]